MFGKPVALQVLLALTAPQVGAETIIFGAASLQEPLEHFVAHHTEGEIVVSYAGSGTIARQVQFGAPAEIVVLANVDWMETLADGGFVDPETITDVATNRLVLAGGSGAGPVDMTAEGLSAALGDGRLAMGFVDAVPVGQYGRAALASLDLWAGVSTRLAEAENARAVTALLARGEVPLGIVYQTDVMLVPELAQVAIFPPDSHPPIRYVAALTRDADADTHAVFDQLIGAIGRDAFAANGFLPPVEAR